MSEWISVNDEMPSNYEDVMIFPRPDFGAEHFIGHYNPKPSGSAYGTDAAAGWFCAVYEQYSGVALNRVHVTHWMPIPKNPE